MIIGGQTVVSPSPQKTSKNEAAKKVYSMENQIYSVFHHKHFRTVCQFGSGRFKVCFNNFTTFSFNPQGKQQSAHIHLVWEAKS